MQKYAIIDLNGIQYKVSPGEEILVDHTENLTDAKVLLIADGDNIKIGNPLVDKAKVELKILDHLKDKKIKVSRYKSKSRYRKSLGFRASKTRIVVQNIS